ncbi:MAG: ATP-dependent DNA helicase RecG [Chloroflexota bacterium]|nr:ATP-dependent DNA helicase RecG [Chloroflexota bacterium]
METPDEKLTKILHLEAEKCQDRAVFGGLARYVGTWLQEAEAAFGPEAADWIQAVADQLHAYSSLPDSAARHEAITALSELLQTTPPPRPSQREDTKETVPAPSAPTEIKSAPATPPPPRGRPRREHPAEQPAPIPSVPTHAHTGIASPITALQGVGPQQAKRLAKLGIHTIHDMLHFFPRRYDDYSQLKPINRIVYGEDVTIIAQVWDAGVRQTRGGSSIFKATLSDGTGFVEATWFNQRYLADRIKRGQQIVISGQVDEYLGHLCFNSPEWEPLEQELLHTARLVPIYSLTQGIHAKWMRRLMKRTVDYWSKRLPDHMPDSVREAAGLMDLDTATLQIHFPDDQELLKRARYRLAFDELFVLQIGLLHRRHLYRSTPGEALPVDDATLYDFIHNLPFELTQAQQRALQQIVADLRSDQPMNRLLQGDVGSGKTAVAAAAMALTVAAGAQAAMMAPTEILSEQHYQTLGRLLEQMPGHSPTIRLLTGSVTGQEREEIYTGLANGSVDVLVGTHALIQKGVQFKNLALAVIDEQHRFGVRQRAALRQKGLRPEGSPEGSPQRAQPEGYDPHLLVMTATPIPRSLELTIWGHMDVSVIDEMPPGREPVTTRLLLPTERERAYNFVRHQIEKGHQAFIICPLVEESEKVEAKAAVDEHKRLQKYIFPELRLGLLHGRMKGEDKEATMARFAQGELDILIATSVVEVGIDVPNATVMLVEGADRFGLAQLHQFRGRVGRGEHASYCLLVSDSVSPEAQERLQAVEATNDGFALAQKDLELRGPGEFLGTRQSGFPDLKLANVTDLQLVEAAREAALRFFETDPELADPDNRLLSQRVAQFWKGKGEVS